MLWRPGGLMWSMVVDLFILWIDMGAVIDLVLWWIAVQHGRRTLVWSAKRIWDSTL
ncbi:hypothetical protein [uncultured Paenibacillus sp.]|uniref:hypothetical protein n=1 Tax=uncultured Paenibacillus sp. TaxID=227322 RepID=UPI0015A8117E|nr:hypothetical protein [uncultured Paenibacillus sp.]